MRRATSLLILMLAVSALAACRFEATDAEGVLWPELSGPYAECVRNWTRKAVIYDGVNMEFSAVATLKSRAWRAAFTDKSAEIYALDEAERAALAGDQEAAHARGTDVVLALESPRWGNERLALDGARWKVFALQGGNKIYPLEIRELDRKHWPDTKLKAFFPYRTRWQTFYELSFVRLAAGPVRLVVSGPAGTVDFDWPDFE